MGSTQGDLWDIVHVKVGFFAVPILCIRAFLEKFVWSTCLVQCDVLPFWISINTTQLCANLGFQKMAHNNRICSKANFSISCNSRFTHIRNMLFIVLAKCHVPFQVSFPQCPMGHEWMPSNDAFPFYGSQI